MEKRSSNLAWRAGSGLAGGPIKGHFFCARVGERVFLRFVPFDGAQLVRNTLSCLRMITCAEDTERHLPDDLATAAYDAWAKARQDIYAEWMFATDPLNLQPRIRPFFRKAAEHLRKYPPSDIRQNELDLLVESIEAPWGIRLRTGNQGCLQSRCRRPLCGFRRIGRKGAGVGLAALRPAGAIAADPRGRCSADLLDGSGYVIREKTP